MTLRVLLMDDKLEAGERSCLFLAQDLYELAEAGRENGDPGYDHLPELPGNSDITSIRKFTKSDSLCDIERACRDAKDPLEFVIVHPLSDAPDESKSATIIDSGWHLLFDYILVDLNWKGTAENVSGAAVFVNRLQRDPRSAEWCRRHCAFFTGEPLTGTNAGDFAASSTLKLFERNSAGHKECSTHLMEHCWIPKCRAAAGLKANSLPFEMSRAYNSGPSVIAFHNFPQGREYVDNGRRITYDPATVSTVVAGTRQRLDHFHGWLKRHFDASALLLRERDRVKRLRDLFDELGAEPHRLNGHQWVVEGRGDSLIGLTKFKDHYFRLNLCGGIDAAGVPHPCVCGPDETATSTFDLINHLAHIARTEHGFQVSASQQGNPQVYVPRQEFVRLLRDFLGSPKRHAGATRIRFETRAWVPDRPAGVQMAILVLRWDGKPFGNALGRIEADDVGSLQPLIQEPWPHLVYDLYLATVAPDDSPLLFYRDESRWTRVDDRPEAFPDRRGLLSDGFTNALVFVIESVSESHI